MAPDCSVIRIAVGPKRLSLRIPAIADKDSD